ncbi:hypothetical protein K4F52_000327 [Lecanicillium sp. MT-2017a]|nr:hypothetical protein K4F52_000327 [Lecanicillium sp. MT-2017a]
MGLTCPGYRDPSGIIIRDESSQTIDRAKSRVTKRTAPSSGDRSSVDRNAFPAQAAAAVEQMLGDLGTNVFADSSMDFSSMGYQDFQSSLNQDFGFFSPFGNNSLTTGTGSDASPTDWLMAGPAQTPQSAIDFNQGFFTTDQTSPQSIASPATQSLDTTSLNFFSSHYVVRQSGPSSGFMDYAPTILSKDDSNRLLEGAALALGYRGLAHSTNQPDLMEHSAQLYESSKEKVKKAVADPQTSHQDNTITALLVLSMYEFHKESSFDKWMRHIDNAASLLALRGKAQFSTATGVAIFKDVFSQVLRKCLTRGVALPSNLRMLRIEATKAIGVSNPYWTASSALVELLDVYQHISPGGYSIVKDGTGEDSGASKSETEKPTEPSPKMHMEDLERYLSQIIEIDYRLESSFSECPPGWDYSNAPNSPSVEAESPRELDGNHHLYHDVWIASVWSQMRSARVLANHAMGHLLLQGANIDSKWFFSNGHVDRLQQISKTVVSIRDDLLASLPQLMGDVISDAQQHVSEMALKSAGQGTGLSGSSYQSPDISTPQSISGNIGYTGYMTGRYYASWLLTTVGCMHNLEDGMRAWVVKKLKHIGSNTGISTATDFAKKVESKSLRPPLN